MLDKRRKGAGKGRGENYSLTSPHSPLKVELVKHAKLELKN